MWRSSLNFFLSMSKTFLTIKRPFLCFFVLKQLENCVSAAFFVRGHHPANYWIHFVSQQIQWSSISTSFTWIKQCMVLCLWTQTRPFKNSWIIHAPWQTNVDVYESFVGIHHSLGHHGIAPRLMIVVFLRVWDIRFSDQEMGVVNNSLHTWQTTQQFKIFFHFLHFRTL